MEKSEIFDVIKTNLTEVLPDLESDEIDINDSMKELGANSIDRSEIMMMTLESLELKLPLIEFVGIKNIRELVDLLYDRINHSST